MSKSIRLVLPARRHAITLQVMAKNSDSLHVTFGLSPDGNLVETFCNPDSSLKVGSDLQAIVNDSCIAISLLLQHGMTFRQLAASFGEDRVEGAVDGPPSSWLGAIARRGAELEREMDKEGTT